MGEGVSEGALHSAGPEPYNGLYLHVSAPQPLLPALSESFLTEHLYFSFKLTWSPATTAGALIGYTSSKTSFISGSCPQDCFTIAPATLLCSMDITQLPVLFHQSPTTANKQREQAVWAMLFWLINEPFFFFSTVSIVFPNHTVSASTAYFVCVCWPTLTHPHPISVMALLLSCGDMSGKICWFFHSSLYWWLCMLNNATSGRNNEVWFPKCLLAYGLFNVYEKNKLINS